MTLTPVTLEIVKPTPIEVAIGAGGPRGVQGERGPEGPRGERGEKGESGGGGGGALEWHALPGLAAFGEPYGPPEYAVGADGLLYFAGLSKEVTAGAGVTLATLPEAAHPSHKRLLWVGNGNNPAFGCLIAINTDGTIKTTVEMVNFILVLDDKSVKK